jgi:hypothetical protein
MLTLDIDTGNIPADVDVVNINWLASQCNSRRGNSTAGPPRLRRRHPMSRTTRSQFTGVGSDGRDMVWRGAVVAVAVGELTVRLAHVDRDVDTARPTWPVEGIVFVSGTDPQRAFAAEVHAS